MFMVPRPNISPASEERNVTLVRAQFKSNASYNWVLVQVDLIVENSTRLQNREP